MLFEMYRRRLLSASALTFVFSSLSASAGALPGHGHFVSGQGSIAKANQSLTVKQSSTTGIINWSSFSVGKKNGVTFDNGAGATLNRVTSGNLSTIAGALHATGSLYIMNSAGVIVSGTGHVITGGGFAASSGNIANAAFGDGRFKPGQGEIINKGTIISGGSVSLAGRVVDDSGSIHASAVALSATHKLGISGNITAQSSTGGAVTARAHTIVIGTDGDIDASASAAGHKGGTISVVARGTTTVAGTLRANGGSNGSGGFIETSGEHVHVADSAQISTLATDGKTGEWLIDPQDFTIAASGGDITGATLSTELGSTDALIQSIAGAKAGNGDIFVDDAIAWSSSHTLTLDAFRNIDFNASISIAGAGGLVLIDADHTQTSGTVGANDGNAGDGDLIFGQTSSGSAADIDYGATNNNGTLSINGASYTLLYSMSEVQDINTNGTTLNLNYALAASLDASATTGWVPIGTDGAGNILNTTGFGGIFEGMGNTISNLTINLGSSDNAGLFGYSSGTIRDVGLVGGAVTTTGQIAGDLIGENAGTVVGSYATGSVQAASSVGGLIGEMDNGAVDRSYATGAVTESGTEGSYFGGLIGAMGVGSVTSSYATGSVMTGAQTNSIGGLIGAMGVGSVNLSFASGAVQSGTNSADTGGLIGNVNNTAQITDSYATGSVAGAYNVGGLIGLFTQSGSLATTFSTGHVSGLSGGNVGALIGFNTSATVSSSYWDTGTSGQSSAIGTDQNNQTVMGLTTAALSSQLPIGFNSGVWGNVSNRTTPYLLGITSNPQTVYIGDGADGAFSLLFTMAQVQAINASSAALQGNYALADSLDATPVTNWIPIGTDGLGNPLNSGEGFSGTFDGLGHTISNLTVNIGSEDFAGMFGFTSGNIRNIGLVGGSVTGGLEIGGLVGRTIGGTISDSYATGSVNGPSGFGDRLVGGLVGQNDGTITDSYATGSATGDDFIGGLVGRNNGTISDSYATGSVSGAAGGGLVGQNNGTGVISDSYAIGAVRGQSLTGGLVGDDLGGTVSDSFWDVQTTGQATSADPSIGLTTAQLQGALPGMFPDAHWATGAGLFPYLVWQFPNGSPQAVSGFAYSDHGVTPLSAATVSLSIVGLGVPVTGAVSTGANGYYYFVVAPGALSGSNVLAYLPGTGGAAFVDQAASSITGLSIDNGYLTETTPVGDCSALASDLATAIGSNSVAQSIVSGLSNLAINATGTSFNIDSAIDIGGGTLILDSAGAITETTGSIAAGTLTGTSHGAVALTGANNVITDLGAFSTGGNNNFELVGNQALTTTGTINAGSGELDLVTGPGKHALAIDSVLKAGAVDLESTSTISESGRGEVEATSLIGSAGGAVTLTSAKNDFTDLADFNAGKFSVALTDDHNLIVTGAVKTSSTVTLTTTGSGHTIAVNNELKGSMVDLVSAASISESAGGNIDAKSLKGSAQGAVSLASVLNAVISLGAFTTAGKNFSLTDDHNLTLKGGVNAGAGTVSLATVGTNHNLAIAGTIMGSTVDLTTTGVASETKKASIAASKVLNVTANSGIKLASKRNAITKLGTDTTTSGPNKVTL